MALFIGSSSPIYSICKRETAFGNGRRKIIVVMRGSGTVTEPKEKTRGGFGLKNLAETFMVKVERAEGKALNVEIKKSGEKLENVAVRVELKNGCVGWGEVTEIPQSVGLAKVKEASDYLCCTSPQVLDSVLRDIARFLPGPQFAPVRAGVEMALIDAAANSINVPLWRLFGGVSNCLFTSISLPTEEAFEMATKYTEMGFEVFKYKIGRNIDPHIKVLKAIQAACPRVSFILDASEAYHSQEAIQLVHRLHDSGIKVGVLEQPIHRDDWKGLQEVSNIARVKYGIAVAADESCLTLTDVRRLIKDNSGHVINVKLAKYGVMGALEIINLARNSGIDLMISSTTETRLATGFAAHLAAGTDCFKYVGLDMPFMLSEDPVICGYEASGPSYKLLNARGQGGFLNWDFTSC